uniref:Uncharacterized protein n=1 Tax=Rhizophora mucronata TaxID=61149 RepID=A0A2P2MCR9_RHIMU
MATSLICTGTSTAQKFWQLTAFSAIFLFKCQLHSQYDYKPRIMEHNF